MNDFKNKLVIVTGGSNGNGKKIVKQFLDNGAKVYNLDKKISKKRKNLISFKINLENVSEIENFVKKFQKKEKKLFCLVNNAGVSLDIKKFNYLEYWNKTININLRSSYILSVLLKDCLKKENKANIINISSISAKIAMSSNPAYNISKAGLIALTKSLAFDYESENIRVNSISPGYIKTNMTKKSFNSKNLYKKRIDRMMLKKYGESDDIANLVIFLASKKSSYINAENIIIDGGLTKKGI